MSLEKSSAVSLSTYKLTILVLIFNSVLCYFPTTVGCIMSTDSGGDMDIIVASDKEVKVGAIREAFQMSFGKATVW